ncbi:Asp-domain-containing protein [Dothidotthia symphoricarpi CBS 119687]|uniref:Asp-domain-containing protein n=1 Tax=Dothidotthia symphoricarpi CBS 119687 TaxID=1392245 RepID=A0A6A6ADH3_9PLEO|nr:Asp-domain-containing protein [Dothidotthia symphoricarpi CBS 119687]KAF2129606.1 Asp-domain-containing protein [Dothidotthia symphoricarpi CBS 119687]
MVLAVPTPSNKGIFAKRSFQVPRHLNTAHPTGPNGPAAMRKVFRKYNLKVDEKFVIKDGWVTNNKRSKKTKPAASAAAAGTGNQTGSVAANPEENAALFLSPVDVGGQTMNLDFDTGSSDLWVFSTELNAATIGQHSAFDASKSTTFKKTTGAAWKISYGDGSGASGTVGTDTVTIGGVKVENQTVELANKVSQSFVQDTNTDGLVGLAFSSLNTVNDGTKSTPQKTFFDNVMPTLDLPVFTADLNPDGSGVYEFGAIDSTKFTGAMSWIPVQSTSGFWQFASTKFSVAGQTFSNPSASAAIADTGTSLLLVDQPVADAYYQNVQGAELNAQVGGYVYPCDAQLPDMAVAIGDAYMATIPGSQITFAAVDQANSTCFGGVQGNQGAGLQIYGDVLFRAQVVAFNGGNQSLGVAPKKGVA